MNQPVRPRVDPRRRRPAAPAAGGRISRRAILLAALASIALAAPASRPVWTSEPPAPPGAADPNAGTSRPPARSASPDPGAAPAAAPGATDPNGSPSADPNRPAVPPDPHAAIRRLLEEDRFDDAIAAARTAVAAAPGSGAAHALLGDALYRRGDFEEAEAAYRAGVAADPNAAEAHFGVGRILRTLGRYGEAAGFYHRAAALAPDNARYVRILSNHLARREDVITLLERYLEMPSNEGEAVRKNVAAWIALLKHLGDEPIGEMVKFEPTDLPLNVLRGQAYFQADLNAVKKVRFAFDTGATGITISPRLAKRAKLETIRPFTITGMGGKGTVSGDLVLIRSLTVGGIQFRNLTATVADPAGTQEEGLFGPSVFGSLRIGIDLATGTLRLRRHDAVPAAPAASAAPAAGPASPPRSVVLPFRNVNGQIFVTATLNGTPLGAMVDTGASSSMATFSAASRVADLELLPGAWSVGRTAGLGGALARKTIRAGRLGIAGTEFRADGMACVDLSRFSRALESEVYLVIGFPELERFVFEIDYRAMTLTFTPIS